MSSIEELKHKLELKVKELDDYIETHKDYLSDEAESIRKEIYELQDKIKLFERTSDKNVAKDIEFLKSNEADALYFRGNPRLKNAIQNILAELKKKDKRIQELEEENEELLEVKISCSAVNIIENLQKENKSKQKAYDDCYCEYKKYKQFDSIPKIEEVHNMKFKDDRLNGATIDFVAHKIQELLEGEK